MMPLKEQNLVIIFVCSCVFFLQNIEAKKSLIVYPYKLYLIKCDLQLSE